MMTPCVEWTGKCAKTGYGWVSIKGRGMVYAHRLAWEEAFGPIPAGMTVDHVCHNEASHRGECAGGDGCPHRRCVNVEHLRLATPGENARATANRGRAGSKPREVCRKGLHSMEDAIVEKGGRRCRACAYERMNAWARENRVR